MPSSGQSIIDAFTHTPWFGKLTDSPRRADDLDWERDPRLNRVLRAFRHTPEDGGHTHQLDLADILAELDGADVGRALLPAKIYYPTTEDAVEAVHAELATLCAGSDGRLKAVGSLVPPDLGAGSYWDLLANVRLIERAQREHGIVGVHITPSPWGLPPNDRWYYPLYAACSDLGLPIFSYIGMPGPLWPLVPNDPIHLDDVALAFPDLTIIAHHLGDPWTETILRLAAHHPNVYVCTSAWSPKRYPAALLTFMAEKWHGVHGCEKVIFASDFPLLDLRTVARDARSLALSESQLRAVLHDNAARLFWPECSEVR